MGKIALIYGSISGAIVIASIMIGLLTSGGEGFGASEAFGYLIMLVALTMIFFGVKRYRDQDLGGTIRFGRALATGLAIAMVSGVVYVTIWECYLALTDYAFINDYTAGLLARKQVAGVGEAELALFAQQMAEMKDMYAKPYIRLPMTFLEIFPVGVLISLISALLLRNPRFLPAKA